MGVAPYPLYTDGTDLYTSFDGGATLLPLGGEAATSHSAAPVSGNGTVGTPFTIASGAIGLPNLATQALNTFVANGTGGTASPTAITAAAAAALLPAATSSAAGLMSAAIAAQFPLAGGGIPVTWTSAVIDLTAVTSNNIIGPRDPSGSLIGGGVLAGYWFVPLGGSSALKFIGVTASGSTPAAGPTGNIGNNSTTRNNVSPSGAGIVPTTGFTIGAGYAVNMAIASAIGLADLATPIGFDVTIGATAASLVWTGIVAYSGFLYKHP